MKELAMLSNLKNVTVNLDAKSKGKSTQVIFCENWDKSCARRHWCDGEKSCCEAGD